MAYDPYQTDLIPGIEIKHSLAELLGETDVLSIHVPLNQETVNLISSKELDLLPHGAWLVNTARGAVLNEPDLLDALRSGHLAGVALDVLAGERTHESQALIEYACTHSNLLITPHIGGATYESMRATEIFMAKKLKYHVKGFVSGST